MTKHDKNNKFTIFHLDFPTAIQQNYSINEIGNSSNSNISQSRTTERDGAAEQAWVQEALAHGTKCILTIGQKLAETFRLPPFLMQFKTV